MASTHRKPARDQGQLAHSLVRELERPDSDVFELFAQLDALPPDTVRAALAGTTGPSRPPEELDDDVRRVHGFPPPPLHLTCTHVITPAAGARRLAETTAAQIERACTTWDGLVLPLAERLAGGPHSLAGAIEHRTLDDLDGMPQFDAVLLHGDSGAIFRAGTTDVLGLIAYGRVEASDRRERTALQAALDAGPEPTTTTATATTTTKMRATAKKTATPKKKAAKAAPKKKAAAKKTVAKKTVAKKSTRKPSRKARARS